MRTINTDILILEPIDLRAECLHKNIRDITINDFRNGVIYSKDGVIMSNFAMFVNKDGTKIIKNRFGGDIVL